jgi:sugar lactone lactonase YvrE
VHQRSWINLPSRFFVHVGPMVSTGRSHASTAFLWVPWGEHYSLQVAQLHRTDGSVIVPGGSEVFGTGTSGRSRVSACVCLATADDRIWAPVVREPGAPWLTGASGVMLRGVALGDQSQHVTNIVVDPSLSPGGVTSIVSDGRNLWLGDTASDRLYKVDPQRPESVQRVPLGQGADAMVFADHNLWVMDALEGRLTRVDPRSGRSSRSCSVAGDLRGLSVGGGFVWVADASGDEIWRVPEDCSQATPIGLGGIGESPNAVAYDAGGLVVGFADGTIAKITVADPSAPVKVWATNVGNTAESIAVDHGVVWAAGGSTSRL